MIRRPPRSTLDRSSAASDVYKRQLYTAAPSGKALSEMYLLAWSKGLKTTYYLRNAAAVSYTHLRAHETVLDLVCRLLLEKTKTTITT